MTGPKQKPPQPRRRSRAIGEVALSIGAAAGVLCLALAAAAVFFGVTPLIVRSGSMEPTIPTGALAIAQQVSANDIRPGDVISVENQQGIRITHRVVSIDSTTQGAAEFTLKGDANRVPDGQPYVTASAERVALHIDGLGYVAAWLSTPAAKILGGLVVAGLVWILIFPTGRPQRHASSGPARGRHARGVAPPVIAIGLAGALIVTLGNAQGVHAAYNDSATATTGSFASRAAFAPRINTTDALGRYVTCSTSGPLTARVVTLEWKHIGPPYRYRIMVRDHNGNVWRTIDVTPPSSTAGSTVSATFGASGFPDRTVQWDYNAEIHTMLPGGAVSQDWRGFPVYQDSLSANRANLSCRGLIETSGGSAGYIPPPTTATCVTNAVAKTATVTWPIVSTYNSYRVSVRDPSSGNLAYYTNASPSSGTTTASTTIAFNNLTAGVLTGSTANVEIRTRVNDATQSTEFVSAGLTVNAATSTVACTAAAAAPSARIALPATTSGTANSSTAPPAIPSSSAGVETTVSTPSSASSSPSPAQTEPTSTVDQPLSPAIPSPSANYSAQLTQTQSGPAVIILDADGTETHRSAATASDSLQWVAGTDDLRVTGPTGTWVISRESGAWVKAPSAQPAIPTTTAQPASPATEAPR